MHGKRDTVQGVEAFASLRGAGGQALILHVEDALRMFRQTVEISPTVANCCRACCLLFYKLLQHHINRLDSNTPRPKLTTLTLSCYLLYQLMVGDTIIGKELKC